MAEGFFDRVAHLAVDGFTAGQTLDIATVIGEQVRPRRDGAAKTALNVVRAALRVESGLAMQGLVEADPTDANRIAALQGRVHAYLIVEETVKRFLTAGEEIWAAMDREDREALADFMGLDIDEEADLSRGFDHD